jgi:hypothetical protein
MSKQISLDVFQYLISNEESDIEIALPGFDENVLIQAKERFGK